MARPAASLNREEVSRLLQLAPGAVDALIDSGALLCQVRNGEARVPLEQLETFFREGLVRLYRVEAALSAPLEPWSPAERDEDAEVQISPPAPAAETPAAPPAAVPPPEDEPLEPVLPQIAAVPVEKPETRAAQRYVPRRQIDGIFNDTRFTILQISASGLRIRHNEPVVPGTEGKVSFALLHSHRSFVMRARVVWTSVATYEHQNDKTFCISGVRVTEHSDRLARAIDLLKASHDLQPERRSLQRPAEGPATLEGVSDEEVAMVVNAMQRFASDPLEATRWYGRARFALADEQVRREAPERPRDREEVLGLWEFLERQVEIPKIAGVVSWMRRARPGA